MTGQSSRDSAPEQPKRPPAGTDGFTRWDLPQIQRWVHNFPEGLHMLAEGFCSLNRWLTETEDHPTRTAAIDATNEFVVRLVEVLKPSTRTSLPEQQMICKSFGILMTLAVEAGPYRYETMKEGRANVVRDVLEPMENLRIQAVRALKEGCFDSAYFEPLAQELTLELYPLIDAIVEVCPGNEHHRYMPFRVVQAAKIADSLWNLGRRLESRARFERRALEPDEEQLIALIERMYELKYPRFGTSGFRGRWTIDFTEDKACKVAQAICDYLRNRDIPAFVRPRAVDLAGRCIVVGYDGRRNSQAISRFVAEVCIANGFRVHWASRATPTPALAYYAREHLGEDRVAGIINCTASHNPAEWQGMKFNPSKAYPAPTLLTDLIAARANEKQLLGEEPPRYDLDRGQKAQLLVKFDPISSYCEWLMDSGTHDKRIPLDLQRIRDYFGSKLVIVDEMHGAGRGYLGRVLGRLGIPHDVIHGETDEDLGDLEYASPEPPYIEPLRRAVESSGAALGVGIDTDADRFGVIDEGGIYFRPNQVLAMLTKYLAVDRGLSGRIVITQTGLPMIDKIAAEAVRDDEDLPKPGAIPAYVDHAFYNRRVGQREQMVYGHVFVVPVGIKYILEIPRSTRDYQLISDEELDQDWMNSLLLGGEESSGLTTRGHVPDKDGIWANLLIMDMIAYYGKPLKQIWLEVTRMPDCWESYGGRVDVDASDRAKEALLNYFLDSFKHAQPGEVALAGARVRYLGGIRYDLVEVFLANDPRTYPQHFLRIRASGTEPLNRIYTESANDEVTQTLEGLVLQTLDDISCQVVEAAHDVWALGDTLASTKPSHKLCECVRRKMMTEKWSPSDLIQVLEMKRAYVELRNQRVVEQWNAHFRQDG